VGQMATLAATAFLWVLLLSLRVVEIRRLGCAMGVLFYF